MERPWRNGGKTTDRFGWPAVRLDLRDSSGAQAGATLLAYDLRNTTESEDRFRSLKLALETVRDWRITVERLFVTIRPWCQTLPGVTAVTEETFHVAEGESGKYEITQLVVTAGRRPLRIYPVAAWVVGWEGLVSIHGPLGSQMIYFSRAKDAWYHIPNTTPYQEILLTEELFRELAESVLYG